MRACIMLAALVLIGLQVAFPGRLVFFLGLAGVVVLGCVYALATAPRR